MTENKQLTTAAVLVEFRRELLEADLPPEEVRDLVREANRWILEDGLVVRDAQAQRPPAAVSFNITPGANWAEAGREITKALDAYRRHGGAM